MIFDESDITTVRVSAQPSRNFVVFSDKVEFERDDYWSVSFNKLTKKLIICVWEGGKVGCPDGMSKVLKPTTKSGALSKPHFFFGQEDIFGTILPAYSKVILPVKRINRYEDLSYLEVDLEGLFPEESKAPAPRRPEIDEEAAMILVQKGSAKLKTIVIGGYDFTVV